MEQEQLTIEETQQTERKLPPKITKENILPKGTKKERTLHLIKVLLMITLSSFLISFFPICPLFCCIRLFISHPQFFAAAHTPESKNVIFNLRPTYLIL